VGHRPTMPSLRRPRDGKVVSCEPRLAGWDLTGEDYLRLKTAMLAAAATPAPSGAPGKAAGVSGPVLSTLLRCLRHEGVVAVVPALVAFANRRGRRSATS
jgi:hypothetical protein